MSQTRVIHLKMGAGGVRRQSDLACEVERSRRKTLAIHVSHDRVVVRCPWQASQRELRQFVENNREWIARRLHEEAQRHRESLRIERGATIFYRARELSIEFKEGRKQRVMIAGNRFVIQGHRLNAPRARTLVEDHLIDRASEYILPRARGLAGYLGVDHKIEEIRLRKTKTKWGHCTSTGILQYNWLIMLAPYSIIDYIISHEVCHLLHMDHSRRFWNAVESVCPNHRHYVDWLREHEHRFWF